MQPQREAPMNKVTPAELLSAQLTDQMIKQLDLIHRVHQRQQRYLRNLPLSRHLGVTTMCLWRWKHDESLNVPPASIINGIEYNDIQLWDKWFADRALNMTREERKLKTPPRKVAGR
jgi:hypothetical protein